MLKLATPAAFTATPAASVAAPSVNVTVPTGTPLPEVTVAVNVTDCPKLDGLGADPTVVEVGVLAAAFTTCAAAAVPLLFCQPAAPANDAVMV